MRTLLPATGLGILAATGAGLVLLGIGILVWALARRHRTRA